MSVGNAYVADTQASGILGKSTAHIRGLVRRKELRSHLIGRKRLYLRADIIELLLKEVSDVQAAQ